MKKILKFTFKKFGSSNWRNTLTRFSFSSKEIKQEKGEEMTDKSLTELKGLGEENKKGKLL
jgi:hypothetical protein